MVCVGALCSGVALRVSTRLGATHAHRPVRFRSSQAHVGIQVVVHVDRPTVVAHSQVAACQVTCQAVAYQVVACRLAACQVVACLAVVYQVVVRQAARTLGDPHHPECPLAVVGFQHLLLAHMGTQVAPGQ